MLGTFHFLLLWSELNINFFYQLSLLQLFHFETLIILVLVKNFEKSVSQILFRVQKPRFCKNVSTKTIKLSEFEVSKWVSPFA